jgi:membrane protein YdbS with pleckstrin-like domain
MNAIFYNIIFIFIFYTIIIIFIYTFLFFYMNEKSSFTSTHMKHGVRKKKRTNKRHKLNSCFYSSFIFLTNVTLFLYLGYTFYAFLFLCLWLTSVLYHSAPSTTNCILDKLSILGVVVYGGYLFFTKWDSTSIQMAIIIVVTFLTTIFLYGYGYKVQRYCFDKKKKRAVLFHSGLHVISSIGHHFIALA